MKKQVKISNYLTQQSTEKAREEKLKTELSLLVKTLIGQEENIIKLIIDCLYDIGGTNLINQKVQLKIINKSLKFISKISKPAFKILAWQWFKNNCPDLITGWLQSKVEFPIIETRKAEVVIENENLEIDTNLPLLEENQIDQIKHLDLQVKMLTGLLVVALTTFTSSWIWLNYSLQQSHLQTVEKLQNKVKILESSLNKH